MCISDFLTSFWFLMCFQLISMHFLNGFRVVIFRSRRVAMSILAAFSPIFSEKGRILFTESCSGMCSAQLAEDMWISYLSSEILGAHQRPFQNRPRGNKHACIAFWQHCTMICGSTLFFSTRRFRASYLRSFLRFWLPSNWSDSPLALRFRVDDQSSAMYVSLARKMCRVPESSITATW